MKLSRGSRLLILGIVLVVIDQGHQGAGQDQYEPGAADTGNRSVVQAVFYRKRGYGLRNEVWRCSGQIPAKCL